MMTEPSTLRAARPIVWMSDVSERDERHLGKVQTLAEEVDTHEDVELTQAQITQDRHPLDRVDVGVEVPDTDAVLLQVVGEVLRHALREGRDEHALVPSCAGTDLLEEVVNLPGGRTDHDLRVDETGRPDQLLDGGVRLPALVGSWRGREVELLADLVLELLEPQRPVVRCAWEPEAVLDEGGLARTVPLVHPPDLRDRHVGLVEEGAEVRREEVQQRVGRLTWSTAVEVRGVVLDAVAEPHLSDHLEVEARPHADPLRLEQLALPLEAGELLRELRLDSCHCPIDRLSRAHVVGCGEERDVVDRRRDLACERVDPDDAFDIIPEELDAHRTLVVGREDLQRVPADAERPARQVQVVAVVLEVDELAHRTFEARRLSAAKHEDVVEVLER